LTFYFIAVSSDNKTVAYLQVRREEGKKLFLPFVAVGAPPVGAFNKSPLRQS